MKYTMDARVRYSESGLDERMTLDAVLKYFQDCAVFHSADIGCGMDLLKENHLVWYLASWQICIGSYPKVGEKLRVSTWAYDFHRMMGDRNHTIEDLEGHVLAWGNSNWVLMDTKKQRPVAVSEALGEAYGLGEKYPMFYAPRKIRVPADGEKKEPLTITRAHLDSNQHVNNAKYVQIAEEYLPENFPIRELRVEYKKQARLGDILCPVIAREADEWIISLNDADGKPCAIAAFQQHITEA